jgi:hypothetical protein
MNNLRYGSMNTTAEHTGYTGLQSGNPRVCPSVRMFASDDYRSRLSVLVMKTVRAIGNYVHGA